MKSTSDTLPERLIIGVDKVHFNYNIHQITIEDPDGAMRTIFEYDYVEIKGKLTKAKILKALEDTKFEIEDEIEPNEIETIYTEAKEIIDLSSIANLTYNQLDTYIDNNIIDLPSAKIYLKKLSETVLAILKKIQ